MSLDLVAAGIGYAFIAFVGILVIGVSIAFVISSLFIGASEIIKLFRKTAKK